MHLLLLPPPPSELSLVAFKAAYGPGLTRLLKQEIGNAKGPALVLDIAILCSKIQSINTKPRSISYDHIQKVLSKLYTLICAIVAEKVEIIEETIDYRVYIVHDIVEKESDSVIAQQGPIFSLKSLASAPKAWTDVFALDGEQSEALLQKFIQERKSQPLSSHLQFFNIHRISGGTSVKRNSDALADGGKTVAKAHFSIAVGGTFDHLHAGHKLLLTATAAVLEPSRRSTEGKERTLTVGITGDELLKNKKYSETLESWEERQKAVIRFLSALLEPNVSLESLESERFAEPGPNGLAVHYRFGGNLTVKCAAISDPFGPTITDATISALVVSGETRSGGMAVNEKRKELGWEPLEVFEISVLDTNPKDDEGVAVETEDFQSKISSTAIRKRLFERIEMK
jgi:phosphopantetheine adenylyltransferase